MDSVTLKQLRYFEAAARHGHFGQAAAACVVSQPALSMQIRELEARLGAALFERAARRVRLTGFGIEVAQRARVILRDVDELGDLSRAVRRGLAGRLRLGVIPTVGPYLLPGLLGMLAQRHSGLDLHVRETVTPRLIDELSEGRIDTAIVALPVSEPELVELPLFAEKLLLVRPAAEAGRPVPGPDALRGMRLLLLEEGHCFRDQALSFCRPHAAQTRRTHAEGLGATSLSTLVQMVGAGLGVTLIPEMAVAVETRSAPVCVARFDEPQPERSIGLVWRRATPLTGQLERLADIVREVGARGAGPRGAISQTATAAPG